MATAAIVLAAGAGTRMKSKNSKVVHQILGKPLVRWVIDAAHEAGMQNIVSVVGHLKEQVEPLVFDTVVVEQTVRNGTAGAVLVCADALADFDGSLVVLSGDCPLITPQTIEELVKTREENDAAVVVLTMKMDNPFGYGRIIRDAEGNVERIVEQKDATAEEAAVTECNSGFYCFDAKNLFEALKHVDSENAQGEFYLTDVLEISRNAGRKVMAMVTERPEECLGVNSRVQLAEATKLLQRRINQKHLVAGVTMWDPDQTWIGPDVELGQDVELLPSVMLLGKTTVGEDSVIGPNIALVDEAVVAGSVLK